MPRFWYFSLQTRRTKELYFGAFVDSQEEVGVWEITDGSKVKLDAFLDKLKKELEAEENS